LCPVGALTSKPYAFNARPWELTRTESVDAMDAVGSNIRIDSRGREVMRVLPLLNEDINEEWISDKTRYACDGLRRQRLDTPYVKRDGKLQAASWDEAFAAIAEKVNSVSGDRIAAIAGDQADCEAMTALKDLMGALGSSNIDCRQDGARIDPKSLAGYIFNTTIAGIEEADACLMIGTNPRLEAPVLNSRLRKRWIASGLKVGAIGVQTDLTYPAEFLGAGPQTLKEIASGSHPFRKILDEAEKPMLIIGQGALARDDGAAVLAMARDIADKTGMIADGWNGFNMLHTAAARVGGLDLGFVPDDVGKSVSDILGGAEIVYLLGADEIDMSAVSNAFVIYQGHHGDAGAHAADVILPGAAYTEKSGTYVNTEGRVQRGTRAVFPPGEAKEDWTIIRALSDRLGHCLPYDSIGALRKRMVEINPVFASRNEIQTAAWEDFGTAGAVSDTPFALPIDNFYMTDPISRASETMVDCTREILGGEDKTGTDG